MHFFVLGSTKTKMLDVCLALVSCVSQLLTAECLIVKTLQSSCLAPVSAKLS